jgi:hypothetical protein
MTATELTEIAAGTHWLCRLAEDREITPLTKFIAELDIADLSAGEIAVAILEATQANGVHAGCKMHLNVFPIEKKMILDAARGQKLNEFIRGVILEHIMRERQP